jgi:hypothetical protein
MTPEEIAARTREEQKAGRNALRRFLSDPAMQERCMADFVPAEELAHLRIDPDVKLPADLQARIARGEAERQKFKRKFYRHKKQQQRISNTSPKASSPSPIFITSVVDKEVQDRRDAALDALAQQSKGKRGQPPMLVRLRVVQIIVDRLVAEGVPFATCRNSRMNKLVLECLNEMAARSRDKSESRCKKIGADAVQRPLKQIKGLGD